MFEPDIRTFGVDIQKPAYPMISVARKDLRSVIWSFLLALN
jgi:hypothetical protein